MPNSTRPQTQTKMPNKDADDVLDFINSLPDTKSSPNPSGGRNSESNDEFKDFLDELSAHEKAAKGPTRSKLEPKKREDLKEGRRVLSGKLSPAPSRRIASTTVPESKTSRYTPEAESVGASAPTPTSPLAQGSKTASEQSNSNPSKTGEETVIDPLSSISLWWNNEGQSKVLSLWGSLASNASQLGESTFQLASNTSQQLSHQRHKFLAENHGLEAEQITHLTGKLNLILSTVSQQIKDGLIDKEDELLNVFLVYDWENTSDLDSLCARKFDSVMGQIEGGVRVTVSNFNHKHENLDPLQGASHYDLGLFYGKAIDGEKLCFANLESLIKDYLKIKESSESSKQEDAAESEDEIATSNIFIAIQPICVGQQPAPPNNDLDAPAASTAAAHEPASGPVFIEANNPTSFAFTLILKDITNNFTIVSKSQPFPLKWAAWLSGSHDDVDAVFSDEEGVSGVDPSEWVNEWVKNGLELSFAVLAQEYITRRMGI